MILEKFALSVFFLLAAAWLLLFLSVFILALIAFELASQVDRKK
jgi:hypothetical protein